MSPNISIAEHMLIVGFIDPITISLVVGVSALSSLGSALWAALMAFLKKRKGLSNYSVTLPDGTEVKFDNTMSQQEVAQKLGSISTNVRSALQPPAKQPE